MKTTITTLKKLILVVVFCLISSTFALATEYVCAGATLSIPLAAPASHITYKWQMDTDAAISVTPSGGVYEITAPSTPGLHTLTLKSTSSDPALCAPADAEIQFIVLDPLTINFTTVPPSVTTYCGTAGTGNAQSIVTATSGGFNNLYSADLEIQYVYEVKKGSSGSFVAGSNYGTTVNGVYTLTATIPDTYTVRGTAKYTQKATNNTNHLKSTGGCPTDTTIDITVIAAPTTPTITISAN